jgi:hypothetical protein
MRIFLRFFWATFMTTSCISLKAQTPKCVYGIGNFTSIKKLNVSGNVLYIAAHPTMMKILVSLPIWPMKKYRTGYLSLTRGDGGQNLIGDEQGIDLRLNTHPGIAGCPQD